MTSLPRVAPRVAKLTVLSLGVALLATACGGSPAPSSSGSSSAAAAGIACPAPSATGAGTSAAGEAGKALHDLHQCISHGKDDATIQARSFSFPDSSALYSLDCPFRAESP